MPQAAVVAGLTYGLPAVATLGGALIGSRSNNKATKATESATNQALAFEREKEARRRQEHDRYQAERMRQWNAFQAQRAGLLRRWGVPMGRPALANGPRASGARTPSGENERIRLTLGDIAGRRMAPPVNLMPIPNAPDQDVMMEPIPNAPAGGRHPLLDPSMREDFLYRGKR
jgi:hypothetical protein